jgi:threonine dehydrogenase-like Zn-dependent dehydrogenase
MRALVVHGPGDLRLEDAPDPVARTGEVLVRPILSGVCGTDLELIDATIDPRYVRYPLILGHEWVGTLVEDLAGTARSGDLVVVEGIIPCGACASCLTGATNRCEVYDEIGFTRPGGLAELIAVPSALVHRIEPDVDPLDASLIEPMAVVWRALTRFPLPASASPSSATGPSASSQPISCGPSSRRRSRSSASARSSRRSRQLRAPTASRRRFPLSGSTSSSRPPGQRPP